MIVISYGREAANTPWSLSELADLVRPSIEQFRELNRISNEWNITVTIRNRGDKKKIAELYLWEPPISQNGIKMP